MLQVASSTLHVARRRWQGPLFRGIFGPQHRQGSGKQAESNQQQATGYRQPAISNMRWATVNQPKDKD
jgi:hypothetical protein